MSRDKTTQYQGQAQDDQEVIRRKLGQRRVFVCLLESGNLGQNKQVLYDGPLANQANLPFLMQA
jgi:hypothetical protein